MSPRRDMPTATSTLVQNNRSDKQHRQVSSQSDGSIGDEPGKTSSRLRGPRDLAHNMTPGSPPPSECERGCLHRSNTECAYVNV